MKLVDRNGQYIIYSDNKDYLMEYSLVIGDTYLSSQGRVTGCDYLFVMDNRYGNVVGVIRKGIDGFKYEDTRKEILAQIKSMIKNYEEFNWKNDNYIGIDLETSICEF